MLLTLKTKTRKAIRAAIALTPWLIAMYVFYWLNASGTWTSETPHRGKISVALLATGMLVSFLIQSHLARREKK
jgi:hypothetical protein